MAIKTPSDFLPVWNAAFNACDLDALLACYTDDAVAVPQPGARLSGKAELGAGLGAFFAMAPFTLNFVQDGLVEGPGVALFFGSYTFTGTTPDGPLELAARATIVLVEKEDGWYAVIDDFFSQG
ncbi:MAG: YybH family protein [Sporichthyaceae bacterium]